MAKSFTNITVSSSIHFYCIWVPPHSFSLPWLSRGFLTTTAFVLSTSFIGLGPVSTCYWEISYLLGPIWSCGIFCYCTPLLFDLGVCDFYCPLNFSFSLLLSLQWLSRLVAHSYYYSILDEDLSVFISFLLIALLISLLNSSINTLPSYLFPLATFLNSYINSFIVLPPCFSLLSFVTFTAFSSLLPNFF